MAFWIPFLISAALQGGASLAQSRAEDKIKAARLAATQEEIQRQDEFRNQARSRFSDLLSTQNREAQDSKEAEERAKLESFFKGNVKPRNFTELLPGQGRASEVTQREQVQQGEKGVRRSLDSAEKRAALDAVGRLGLSNDIAFANTRQDIGGIGDSAYSSSSILPLELEAANQKGRGLQNLAGLLRGLSTATSLASGSGLFGGGGGPEQITWATTPRPAAGAFGPWQDPAWNIPAAGEQSIWQRMLGGF